MAHSAIDIVRVGQRIYRVFREHPTPESASHAQMRLTEESQLDLLYDDDVDDDYVERSTGIVFDQFEGETIEPVESIEEEDDQGKGEQKEDVIEGITEDTQRIKNTCQVHPRFHGIIIGKKHSKINELMKETGCKIKIPNKNSGSSEIAIYGSSWRDVESAITRIKLIVASAIEKEDYTHFVCFPLTQTSFKERMNVFKDELLHRFRDTSGMSPSIILNPNRLHLTILMLKLYSSEEIEQASQVLRSASSLVYDAVNTRCCTIRISGIDQMNDDPRDAHVLFGCVNRDENAIRLSAAAKVIVDAFLESGLTSEEELRKQRLKNLVGQFDWKTHATVLNTRYRSESDTQNKKRIPLDATDILSAFSSFDFGQERIPSIQLSERKSFDSSGFYSCVAEIPLP